MDDESAARTDARIGRLVDERYRVLEAPGAEQAMRELDARAEGVALLLCDVVMPKMSGPELAEHLDCSEEQALEALQAASAYHATSLDTPRGTEAEPGDTLADTIGGDDDNFDRAEERATIDRLMRSITPREREVLRLRFEEDLTQAEIGEIIGVSQMQVSRLIRQAVTRLRTAAQDAPARLEP